MYSRNIFEVFQLFSEQIQTLAGSYADGFVTKICPISLEMFQKENKRSRVSFICGIKNLLNQKKSSKTAINLN